MARRTATFSLLPSVKRDWLKALRSGKYSQAQGGLYDPISKGFCCLGVLCEVNGIERSEMVYMDMPQDVGFGKDATPERSEIPKGVEYDANEYAWSVLYNGKLTPLSVLNDSKGLSFKQIADIIEKRVPTHR